MKRREFVAAVGRTAGLAVGGDLLGLGSFALRPPDRLIAIPLLLIPMDESQSDHLKAYGVA
jgi:hypothetical protein